MEPMMPQKLRGELRELSADLMKKASSLNALLHPQTALAVKELLRSMNSYYSNLIEGQSTNPISIDEALKKNYESDPKKRDLQKLAIAHIETQRKAETALINAPDIDISSIAFLKFLHREFYSNLPEIFLEINHDGGVKLIPGELRNEEVKVGSHLPPLSSCLEAFLTRFNEAYSSRTLDPLDRIIAGAAAHHRLAWVHPFLDGNGRVTRLFSDCFFMKENLGGFGLWTISRGLARKKQLYYNSLSQADDVRKGDYDGRGALSDESLGNFCRFFLETAIDQVEFMAKMLSLEHIERRLARFVEILADLTQIKEESFYLLRDLFLRGQIPRGDAPRIMNLHERTARDVVANLTKLELVKSETPKSNLHLHFNTIFAYSMFPNLYPEGLDLNLGELLLDKNK
jgi:Fic family protein